MPPRRFSINEAIAFGWNATIQRLGFLIVALVIAFLVPYIPAVLAAIAGISDPFLVALLGLISWALGLLMTMGLIKIAVEIANNRPVSLDDLFNPAPLLLNYAVGSILYGLLVAIGLILLIIPGIYFAIKFQFFSFLIVDRGVGPIESLKQSSALTDGVKWDLLLFDVLLILIQLAGALLFLVGLLVAIPVTLLATAYVYRTLLAQTERIAPRQAA